MRGLWLVVDVSVVELQIVLNRASCYCKSKLAGGMDRLFRRLFVFSSGGEGAEGGEEKKSASAFVDQMIDFRML